MVGRKTHKNPGKEKKVRATGHANTQTHKHARDALQRKLDGQESANEGGTRRFTKRRREKKTTTTTTTENNTKAKKKENKEEKKTE